jgi:hypothetical protein
MRRLKRAEVDTAKVGGDPALLLPHNDRMLAEMLREIRVARPSETSWINSELAPYHAASLVSRSPDAQLPAQ